MILLAAGRSQRMGSSKPLLPLGEKLLIHHCLDNLLDAGLDDIAIVVRQDKEQLQEVLSSYTIRIIENKDSESDMAGSVRCGLSRLPPETSGVLVSLVDHPVVQPSTLRRLNEFHRLNSDSILLPVYQKKRGHPTLFPSILIQELLHLPTLRDIVHKNRNKIVELEVDDRGVILDTDTREDYQQLIKYYNYLQDNTRKV